MLINAASLKHLEDVHGDIRACVLRGAELSQVRFEIEDGRRTLAEQRENFRKGVSKTMKSRHLTGHAVDIIAYRDGKIAWEFPKELHVEIFQPAADAIKLAASELGVPLEWGQDLWGWDAPHFQLPWADYPEGAEVSFLDAGKSYDPARYEAVVARVLETEAGWNPADPSMRGVTLPTYQRWDPRAGIEDLKKLTEAKAKLIYRALFWHPVSGDDLPAGLDYAVFDFAVHSGPPAAISALQEIIGTEADGIFGPLTLAALKNIDVLVVINKLMKARFARMKTLSNWARNAEGWTIRIASVLKQALEMAKVEPPQSEPQKPLRPKTLADYSETDLRLELRRRPGVVGVSIQS